MEKKKGKKVQGRIKTNDRKYYSLLFAILIVTIIAYLPVFNGSFVWDDDQYIQNNPLIQSINLGAIFSNYVLGNYHPITILIYSFEYHFWGFSETGYHAVNLMIHLLNVILVFKVIKLLVNNIEIALIVSALFGIHPLHVESVAWVSELKDVLYTFFFLAAYFYYIQFIKAGKRKYYLYSLSLFLLSFFSKGMAASFPVLLLLTDYFIGKKIDYKNIISKLPFFLISFILGIVAIFAQQSSGATQAMVFPFPERIVYAAYGFINYLIKLIIPVNLSAFYSYPVRPGGSVPINYYIYPIAFIALIAGVIYSLRKTKKIFFGFSFFVITIFLVLQLLPVGEAIMADRYSYIPSIGIFYLAAEGIYYLWNKYKSSQSFKNTFTVLLLAAGIIFSAQTYSRCEIWKSSISLWNDVISKYDNISSAYNNRGIALTDEKNDSLALQDYNRAIDLQPAYSRPYNNRGVLLMNQNKNDEALRDFNKTIELESSYAKAYNNRGLVLQKLKQNEKALIDFNKAINLNPNYCDALNNRGGLYASMNKFDESLSDFNLAIRLQPDYYLSYYNRGYLFGILNRMDDAISDFNKAIKLKPDYAIAYSNRALCYSILNNNEAALNDYLKAIELNPSMIDAYFNAGLTANKLGQVEMACRYLQQAATAGMPQAVEQYGKICK